MDRTNGNRFSVYTSEEKTVLGLLGEMGTQINNNADNLENKTDLHGDHKGTWQGLNRPTMSEEGVRATVEDIIDNKIPTLETSLDNINNKINYIVRPEMFDGADDGEKIQKAIDYLVTNKIHGIVKLFGNYTINKKIVLDMSYCSIEGNAIINSLVTNGESLLVTGGSFRVNNISYQSKAFIRGIILRGTRVGGSIGILYNGYDVSGLTIENFEIQEFDIGERFESNAYIISHIGGSIGRCNIGAQMPIGFSNYGENISYNSCTISNCEICVQNVNPNGNFHFNNCSLDYSVMLVDAQRGGVFLNNCHMETNNNNKIITKAIFKTGASQDAYIKIDGGLIMYWNKPNFEITSCFETAYDKDTINIYVDGTKFYNVYQFTDALCSGTGKIKLQNIKETTEGYIGSFGIISKNNNLLNPDFYNNFMEVDITKYTGNKTNNVTCENVSIIKYGTGMKVTKTTGGSNGTLVIYVPIKENICTYSLKLSDIGESNDNNIYLDSSYAKIKFDSNGYIKDMYKTKVGATRTLTPKNAVDVEFTNQATGLRSPAWATHYVLEFNMSAYKGSFALKDIIINAL